MTLTSACGDDGLHLDSPEPPSNLQALCRELVSALPAKVADQPRQPDDSPWAAAWGDPPITLSCGVDRPADFVPVSLCTTVNGVDWYIPRSQSEATGPVDTTITAVYRKAYLRLDLPEEYWPPATALVDLAAVVKARDPAVGSCA